MADGPKDSILTHHFSPQYVVVIIFVVFLLIFVIELLWPRDMVEHNSFCMSVFVIMDLYFATELH